MGTSHLAQQLSNWKRSPIVLGRSNMNTVINDDNDQKNSSHNATHNNHKRQPQEEEQQQEQQKNQIRKVVTTNKTEQEPRSKSTTTTTTTKKYKFGNDILPSSFTFPTLIPTIPRSSSSKEQPPQISTTTYCDRNGNEQTLVEENRRQASHTWMDLSY